MPISAPFGIGSSRPVDDDQIGDRGVEAKQDDFPVVGGVVPARGSSSTRWELDDNQTGMWTFSFERRQGADAHDELSPNGSTVAGTACR